MNINHFIGLSQGLKEINKAPKPRAVKFTVNNINPNADVEITGDTTKKFREHYGLGQDALAQALRVSVHTLRAWEQGSNLTSSSQQLMQFFIANPDLLFDYLGITLSQREAKLTEYIDYQSKVLLEYNNSEYQKATGDVNMKTVPRRVNTLWHGKNGVAGFKDVLVRWQRDYDLNADWGTTEKQHHHVINTRTREQEKFTSQYFKRIYEDFKVNGFSK